MFCGQTALFEIVIVVEVAGAVQVEPEPVVGVPGFDELFPPQAIAAAIAAADAA
jgi:hypothetical protein